MFLKEEMILPEGFTLSPDQETHIRIGRIESVSLNSRDAVIQFVDGSRDEDNEFLEKPVSVTVVVGSDEPETTYAPSAAVYGRGDLVAVMLMADGQKYVASPMDRYEHSNRENYALVKGWALHDVLNGLLVDFNDDLENSYLEFWDIVSEQVTRISGDPDKRNVLRRLLDYYKKFGQNHISYTHVDYAGWPRELTGGGPANCPQLRYENKVYDGRGVNGFNYVEWDLFAQADLTSDMTAYHSTLTGLTEALCHPLADATLDIHFEAFAVVWFEDNPDYVLMIGSFPAWSTAPYLKFIEVPVNSLSGRKKLDPDEDDNDKIVLSWQQYTEHAREIHSIHRSYIDWTAFEGDIVNGERLYRALSVYTNTPVDSSCTFGFIDGFGYDQSGVVMIPNKLRKVDGDIVRTLRMEGDPYSNGSMFNYEITHNNPVSSGVVDNWYSIHSHFFNDNDTIEYTDRTNNNPDKEYPVLTNGTDSLTKKIDFDYHVDGHYGASGGGGGLVSWSDGQDGSLDGCSGVLNQFWQRVYHNGSLLYTDTFSYEFTTGPYVHTAEMAHHFLHFSDIEMGLFVIERATGHYTGAFGPGYDCDEGSYIKKELVVFYGGQEYVIWEITRVETTFSTIYNYYPWIQDSGVPDPPTTPPYDTTDDHNCVFYLTPVLWTFIDPLSDYKASVGPYPAPTDDPCTLNWVAFFDNNETHKPSDYLQVSVDHDSDSWVVRCPCPLSDSPSSTTIVYPNTGDTVMRFNGAAPHFNKPAATVTITL